MIVMPLPQPRCGLWLSFTTSCLLQALVWHGVSEAAELSVLTDPPGTAKDVRIVASMQADGLEDLLANAEHQRLLGVKKVDNVAEKDEEEAEKRYGEILDAWSDKGQGA